MGIGYRAFGFLSFGEGDGLRFTWLQIVCPGYLALEVHDRGRDHDDKARWSIVIGLALFTIYLSLPFLNWLDRELTQRGRDGFWDSWGFSYRFGKDWHSDLHLNWGNWGKIIAMPWALKWVRTSLLVDPKKPQSTELLQRWDGRDWWFDELAWPGRDYSWDRRQLMEPSLHTEYHSYEYRLKSGEVQQRVARVRVEEREWRRRLFWPHLKLGRKVSRTIDVQFDGEVGERTGSWKGGVIGCGYDMRPGETPLQCLRRMERDRRFP